MFKCGENLLNKLDTTCAQTFVATPKNKYYTKLFRTITDCNDCNGAPLRNCGYFQSDAQYTKREQKHDLDKWKAK